MGILSPRRQLRSWVDGVDKRLRNEHQYTSLSSEGSRGPPSLLRFLSNRSRRLRLLGALIFTAVLALLWAVSETSASSYKNVPSGEAVARYLHLLVPADHAHVNLCQTILSAAVHDYPTPTLINWAEPFDNPALVDGGSHVGKIKGVLNYLKALAPERDDDLVILVDGYDVWFQVRPEVMIQRYHEINAKAEARMRKSLGDAVRVENLTQTILFAAQKRCWPHEEDDTACYAVPQSSLPKDVYGPDTDTDAGDYPFVKNRQRYLNSGNAIGPVRDLRKLYERALKKAEEDPNNGSDQWMISEIFGDQEYQREFMRQRHLTRLQRFKDWLQSRKSFTEPHPTRHQAPHYVGQHFEFRLGLDYASSLGQATVFAEEDLEWLHFNNTKKLPSMYRKHDITHPGVSRLPTDIENSAPPFWSIAGSQDLPTNLSWNNLPFYTNLWTGTVPALLHHNAHRDGLKARRETFWPKTWFQPYARALLSAHVAKPHVPLVVSRERNGTEVAWWNTYWEKGGAKSDRGVWLPWQEICRDAHEEIFRDGLGEWVDPR